MFSQSNPASRLSIEVPARYGRSVVEVPHPSKPGIMVEVHLVGHAREGGIVIEVERAVLVEEETGSVLKAPYEGLILFGGYVTP